MCNPEVWINKAAEFDVQAPIGRNPIASAELFTFGPQAQINSITFEIEGMCNGQIGQIMDCLDEFELWLTGLAQVALGHIEVDGNQVTVSLDEGELIAWPEAVENFDLTALVLLSMGDWATVQLTCIGWTREDSHQSFNGCYQTPVAWLLQRDF